MSGQNTYSTALNVKHALVVSAAIGGGVLLGCLVFLLGYLAYEEIKYRRKRESKHTRTQENKLPVVDIDEGYPERQFDSGPVSKITKVVGRHHMPESDPTITSPDLARIVQDISANAKQAGRAMQEVAATGKHRAPSDELVYGVTETIPDWGIPREAFQHDGPVTRLDFLKATDADTDYFNKIKDMVDGI